MPKDWGEKWETCFIPKPHVAIMNKSLLAIIAVIVVGAGTVFAVSPYFTESTVDDGRDYGRQNDGRDYGRQNDGRDYGRQNDGRDYGRQNDGRDYGRQNDGRSCNVLCWNIHRCW